jgi:hypothetical protein
MVNMQAILSAIFQCGPQRVGGIAIKVSIADIFVPLDEF